ncbi:multicomponent Na+:H+ antiporter subunit F [Clostridium tetanomorphum]|uniref:Cation:proton antiporter n=1 Tax=Clostridium tetanomorphum TaxID=1553 RepID=A0A923EA92_CLOTT|nr:monovalent cation/H+ antiporter complex subunit F [Clostridium tetanomorphum]KAJ52471.1 multiple resistance and pH regulation protein F [Clostridium tetanomorphum DSM 665]MBC2399497.1 cation:proton antiporter [Clostridium tetanomorphum]MBP1864150.1 multicomponent Na+:H+ antiporter subunit F [Clostridium tetanomorphum]NRS84563.1 multicomponent Na+:H+ antiporter subunit F [Clostridium tetanomorphum]NRZ97777.1 multicomponent Na+:H+ antiporter subunit F [Clostridium tetanomorphum]
MIKILTFSIIFLSITIIGCMYRAIKGPSAADRLIAINVISTKTIVLIIMVSFILSENYFVDVALVYALISFIASVVIANYIENLGGKN